MCATEKKLLTYSGIYPLKQTPFYYNYSRFINLLFSFVMFASLLLQMLFEDDVSKIIDSFYFASTEISYICKLVNFLFKRNYMVAIENILNSKSFNSHVKKQYVFLIGAIEETGKLGFAFRVACGLTSMAIALFPIIDNPKFLKPPFPGWYFVNPVRFHTSLYCFQIVAVCLSCINNTSIDILNIRLIRMGTAQLDVLIDNLKFNVLDDNLTTEEFGNINKIVEERLKVCIEHHLTILK